MTTVTVKTEPQYGVLLGPGLLARAGELLAALHRPCRIAVVADAHTDRLFSAVLCSSLTAAGFEINTYTLPPGEAAKSLETLGALLGFLSESGLGRDDLVAALGGGVVGDIAGFAAGIYLRGIGCVQFPTTLLAAADSAIGGKSAIDLPQGKNLAGCIRQPLAVFCDTDTLAALPQEEVCCGAAEIIKYGMIADPTLLDITPQTLSAEPERILARCVQIKADAVAADEFDTGTRRLLNFGHTFGHAIERLSGYTLPHGFAVAAGMLIIARAAGRLGWSQRDCAAPLEQALARFALPPRVDFSAAALVEAAFADKKRSGDRIALVIPSEPGRCCLRETPLRELESICRAGLTP